MVQIERQTAAAVALERHQSGESIVWLFNRANVHVAVDVKFPGHILARTQSDRQDVRGQRLDHRTVLDQLLVLERLFSQFGEQLQYVDVMLVLVQKVQNVVLHEGDHLVGVLFP